MAPSAPRRLYHIAWIKPETKTIASRGNEYLGGEPQSKPIDPEIIQIGVLIMLISKDHPFGNLAGHIVWHVIAD